MSITPGTTTAVLDWSDNPVGEGVTSYNVYQGGSLKQNVGGSVATLTGLAASTTYSVFLTAVNAAGESAPSTSKSFTTTASTAVPAAPTLLTAAPSSTNVVLDWANNATSDNVTVYRVYRVGTGLVQSPAASTATVSGLTPSTAYSFYVTAVNSFGESSPSATVSTTTTGGGGSLPAAPTGLTANPASTNVVLDWAANAAGDNVTSYKVYQQDPNTGAWGAAIQTVTGSPPPSTATVGGLTASVTYWMRVTAVNATGESLPSGTVAFTTDPVGTAITLPIGSGPNQFDPTGTEDLADRLTAWLKRPSLGGNVPNGTLNALTHVIFPRVQANGQPAKYRIEREIYLANMSNVFLDGQGGSNGAGGAQFINKVKDVYKVVADDVSQLNTSTGTMTPGDNPRGARLHDANPTSVTTTGGAGGGILNAGRFDFVAWGVQANVDKIIIRDVPGNGAWSSERFITSIDVNDPTLITYNGGSVGNFSDVEFVINPNLAWNVAYSIPTPDIIQNSYEGNLSGGSAYERAFDKADNLNAGRTMFYMTTCTHVRFGGFKFSGCYDGSGYDKHHYAQDGFRFYACTDCEIGDSTVEKMWGNGLEFLPQVLSNGTHVATIGIWVHNCLFGDMTAKTATTGPTKGFGRQCFSLSYGGHFIVEDTSFGGSGRSVIDCEPDGNHIDPRLTSTIQGVYLVRCDIGHTDLGNVNSIHGGTTDYYIGNCTGYFIGTPAQATVDRFIAEFNTEHGPEVVGTSRRYRFLDSSSIWIHNNVQNNYVLSEGVLFDSSSAGCTNYRVINNDWGTNNNGTVVQFTDSHVPPWSGVASWDGTGTPPGAFTAFTLPIPAHALRDLP